MSIEEELAEIESRRFVGREAELAELAALVSPRAAVAYLYGPSGIGKTALLRAFIRRAETRLERRCVYVPVGRSGEQREPLLRRVASTFEIAGDQAAGEDDLGAAVLRYAGQRGLVLVIDDYDALGQEEAAVRERLLYRLPDGVLAVLAGRSRPSAVWPLERAWRQFVRQIPLAGLSAQDADRLLAAQGVDEPEIRREAYLLTAGRPGLLSQVADLLAADEQAAAGQEPFGAVRVDLPHEDVPAFLLEQILHPGSRRQIWRAEGSAGAIDSLVACAALLPAFSRDVLAAMAGQDALSPAWELLRALPCAQEAGGWYRLEHSLRTRIARIVLQQHPWRSVQWLRRALAHCLRTPDLQYGGRTRQSVALQIRLALSSGRLSAHLGLGSDGAITLRRSEEAPGDAADALAFARHNGEILIALAPDGETLGAACAIPAADCPPPLRPTGDATQAATVGFAYVHAADALGPLLAEIAAGSEVAALASRGPAAAEEISDLGFTPRDGTEDWRVLELAGHSFFDVLARSGRAMLAAAPATEPAVLAKEVLQVLAAGGDLLPTCVGSLCPAEVGKAAGGLRAWVLDALDSADFGTSPCSLRQLLWMYYVDRIGPHEEIAERLDLPRATYFRAYRQALRQFGVALCGGSLGDARYAG